MSMRHEDWISLFLEAAYAWGMNACDHRCNHPPEPTVGDLRAGEAKHMGVPCMLPRAGWRERVRQWRRR